MEQVMKENKMGTMKENTLLITMSLPIMISMLIQAMYNIVDSLFVSRINEDALTALSLAFPVQNMIIAIGVGTAVGINAMLSRYLGEHNQEQVNKVAINGIFLTVLSYIPFFIFGIFFTRHFFTAQTNEAQIVTYGTTYLTICSLSSFAQLGQITCERLLQSTGKTVYSMYSQAAGAIFNIILDPILIFGLFGLPKMGVAGAAIATILGQLLGLLLGIVFNLSENKEIHIKVKGFRPSGKTILEIYKIGFPAIIMQSISSVMVLGLNKILIGFTTTASAVLGIYFKLQSFVFMPVFGLTNGMVPIIGYNYGARRPDRIKKVIKLGIGYATGIMLLGLIVMQLFPVFLLQIFDASEDMLSIGTQALRIISLSFVFAGFGVTCSAIFQALGNGMMSLLTSILRQLVVILPSAYLLAVTLGVHAVWWSFPIAEVASLILCIVFLRRVFIKEINPLYK